MFTAYVVRLRPSIPLPFRFVSIIFAFRWKWIILWGFLLPNAIYLRVGSKLILLFFHFRCRSRCSMRFGEIGIFKLLRRIRVSNACTCSLWLYTYLLWYQNFWVEQCFSKPIHVLRHVATFTCKRLTVDGTPLGCLLSRSTCERRNQCHEIQHLSLALAYACV